MTNQNNSISKMEKPVSYQVNGDDISLTMNQVKQFIAKGGSEVTEQELIMFMKLCQYQKLNPFINEAYLIKFKGAQAQMIVSKEAFMKRAESHPQYTGLEAGIIVERNNELHELEGAVTLESDKLVGGWAKIYRKDRERPIVVKISMKEFSKGQSTWKQMPNNMIRKTAIVNALREAFPENLQALYTEEERKDPVNVNDDVQKEINQNANKTAIDIPKEEPQKVEKTQEIEQVEVEQPQFEEVKEPKQAKQSIFDEGLFGNEN